jgi:hypothetical protein
MHTSKSLQGRKALHDLQTFAVVPFNDGFGIADLLQRLLWTMKISLVKHNPQGGGGEGGADEVLSCVRYCHHDSKVLYPTVIEHGCCMKSRNVVA